MEDGFILKGVMINPISQLRLNPTFNGRWFHIRNGQRGLFRGS